MAWRLPKRLQLWSAVSAVTHLVGVTEEKIRDILALVPAELLIARATAGLLLHQRNQQSDSDDEGDTDEDTEQENGSREITAHQDIDVMDYAQLQIKMLINEVQKWWQSVPGIQGSPGNFLRCALSNRTEVHPRHDQDFPRHLTCLLLKLVLLDKVFIDRDYGDKDRRCVVPFAWEQWTAQLVAKLAPFHGMRELKVYGGMYPSIMAAVLKGASALSSLHISHINITDEVLLVASRSCQQLESLYLLHNFPWQVISMKAFCGALFSGASKREVIREFRSGKNDQVTLTFPSLKQIEISYGEIDVAKEFHKYLLFFYTNLESISCDWKTNIFEDGYSWHCQDVLLPITSKGNILSLTAVYIHGVTINSLSSQQLHQLAWCCPLVKRLILDCALQGSARTSETTGKKLCELVKEWPYFSELHVSVNTEDHLTRALLTPILKCHGSSLRSFTLEVTSPGQQLHVATLNYILQLCPSLEGLHLRMWNRNMLEAQLSGHERLQIPDCVCLKEVSLHEDGPGDDDEPSVEAGNLARWLALLQALVDASPNLQILSISVCQGLACILDKLSCDIQVLHIHVKDGHEWQPSVDQVCQLVNRVLNLQQLYLEEVSGRIFWRVRRRYQNTDLQVHWGNLNGWPRT